MEFPRINLPESELRALADSENLCRINTRALSDEGIHALASRYAFFQALLGDAGCDPAAVEKLTREHAKPEGMEMKDALVIRNEYKTFSRLCTVIRDFGPQSATPAFICDIHRSLSRDLLVEARRGTYRDHIHGMKGLPDAIPPQEVKDAVDSLCREAETIENTSLRAMFLSLNLVTIQPFSDVNKRTARMVEAAVLMSDGIAPTIGENHFDAVFARRTEGWFYERADYSQYAAYVTNLRKDRRMKRNKDSAI